MVIIVVINLILHYFLVKIKSFYKKNLEKPLVIKTLLMREFVVYLKHRN